MNWATSYCFACTSMWECFMGQEHEEEGLIHNIARQRWFKPSSVGRFNIAEPPSGSDLLFVDGIPGELRQMHKLQVKGPKLGQDAAPGWGPAPAPTGATATEATPTQVSIRGCHMRVRAHLWFPAFYQSPKKRLQFHSIS